MIVIEMWADLTYPGSIIDNMYSISTNGRIFSKFKNGIMSDADDGRGYRQISLITENGRSSFKVHRLVMLTFYYIPGCEQLEVNHKNGIKTNNTVYNLEWVTGVENIQKAYAMGLFPVCENMYNAIATNDQVHLICKCLQEGMPVSDIITLIGYTEYKSIRNLINGILRGDCWTRISSQYTFPFYDTSVRKFTDNEVLKMCDLLELNLNYKQILEALGYDITTMDVEELKLYSNTISNIRKGKFYTDISKDKKFSEQRSCQVFSNEQIHFICKLLEDGLSYDDILTNLNLDMNSTETFNYKSILSAIKNRVRFIAISKDYKF